MTRADFANKWSDLQPRDGYGVPIKHMVRSSYWLSHELCALCHKLRLCAVSKGFYQCTYCCDRYNTSDLPLSTPSMIAIVNNT
jgi:hypothetical protein